ncbi:MAG: UDP-N-acetylmuramoyl-L-alanyl-D-glutamate--2,6-diaminopimelate ligase [Bacteroidota bacterium]|nr:UDP-N-acetylmuramoyl-L-alanyl-D-glutamate--2,6-diaminopimelate ligase [Bacteroidota bacterium]
MSKSLLNIAQSFPFKIQFFGNENPLIENLVLDSRDAKIGSLFFAVVGTKTDAHQFIPQIIENGVSAIVCSKLPDTINPEVAYVLVEDVQQSVGYFASAFYDFPSEKLKLIGVTGTNGKTTCTSILFHLFQSLGYQCGLISTVEYLIGNQTFHSTHTTPDPIKLNALLHQMVEAQCSHCFMEVSSHSVVQGRINGLAFDGGVFTNITHDHLDYHGTFDAYIKAKKGFFDALSIDAFALTNADDKNGKVMLQNTKASKYTYAIHSPADFTCKVLECDFNGLLLRIEKIEAWFNLVGKFNAYNLLTVYATAFLMGEKHEDIITHLTKQTRVSGRFEVLRSSNGVVAIVDYAHTPDALENVLETINQIRTKNEQLITVVGCGGDRDKEKRPKMGKISTKMSDKVIFTSDNPRSEKPEAIIEEMIGGVDASHYKKMLKIVDRKEAIRTALMMSQKGDIILVAGKGHETYQEIQGVKHAFDDRIIIYDIFKELQ